MGERDASTSSIRAGGWWRVPFCIAVVGAAVYSPGCGGQVLDANVHGDDPDASGPVSGAGSVSSSSGGGSGVAGRGGKGGGKPATGSGGAGTKAVCGNGVREVPESCDGKDLGGATCAAATMGAYPTGTLFCTKTCDWDMTRCTRTGGGGATGAGGTTAADGCFDQNGVPSGNGTGGASGSCAFGSAATALCDREAISPIGDECVLSCGCSACPGSFTRCSEDAYCAPIFACALAAGCRTVGECETACAPVIKSAEAAGSQRVRYADLAVACYTASCSYPCAAPPPIGR
ncbi:MAG TPA: hypothetical protein VHE30_15775 [Polyangiaceae bacterium]|nr:hypothetical protein [Polyangiaceae bacterium]